MGELQGLGASPPPPASPSPSPSLMVPASELPTPPLALAPFHPGNLTRAVDRTPARLFWLTDELSGMKLLVDSGAATSVIPHSHIHSSVHPGGHHLVGAGRAGSRATPQLGLPGGGRKEGHHRGGLPHLPRFSRGPTVRMCPLQRGSAPRPPLFPPRPQQRW